jgi:formamidopyrimidine-DNA glycosylase
MPELPEVETTRRGIAPYLEGQRVSRVIVRERRLRWPIPEDLDIQLYGQRIECVERRAKYLLIKAETSPVWPCATPIRGALVRCYGAQSR